MNCAPAELQGNSTKDHLLDCYARHMLKNWKRPDIEGWLRKNPAKAADMRERLNNQKGKRP